METIHRFLATQRFGLLGVLALLTCGLLLAGSHSATPVLSSVAEDVGASSLERDEDFFTPGRLIVVPLKSNRQALMVDTVINQQALATMIVDTGATYTSISRDVAESLGVDLANADRVMITTANGRIEVPKIRLKSIRLNGVEAHNVEATVIDVRRGASFSGLLGLSFIKKFKLTIDPAGEQLIFHQQG